MKSYSLFEFEGCEATDSTHRESKFFNTELLKYALKEIEYIVEQIKTFQQNDEEIFDILYRRSRMISGLVKIHKFHVIEKD